MTSQLNSYDVIHVCYPYNQKTIILWLCNKEDNCILSKLTVDCKNSQWLTCIHFDSQFFLITDNFSVICLFFNVFCVFDCMCISLLLMTIFSHSTFKCGCSTHQPGRLWFYVLLDGQSVSTCDREDPTPVSSSKENCYQRYFTWLYSYIWFQIFGYHQVVRVIIDWMQPH